MSPFSQMHRLMSAPWVRVLGGLGVLAASSACDVELLGDEPTELAMNSCERSSECGSFGTCQAGQCQANSSDFPSVLLEVVPATGSTSLDGLFSIGGLRFFQVIDAEQLQAGSWDIDIGHVSYITGSVKLPELTVERCLPIDSEAETYSPSTDGTVAARVTLTPRSRLLGLPAPATSQEVVEPGDEGYRIEMTVPPGNYDVYVEPLGPLDGCVHPPILVLDEEFGPGNVPLLAELNPPELLGVTVRFPRATADLQGWTLDLIQKDSGRLLSNRAVLGEPEVGEEDADFNEYRVDLAYSNVTGEDGGNQLVRLSPPEGAVAPTVYLERSVVDLFQNGTGLVDQLTDLPTPVVFSGRATIESVDDISGSAGTVVLVATALDGTNEGTVSAFSRTVETDEDGNFEAELLPGEYRVLIEPADPAYAATVAELTVTDAPMQSGRTFDLNARQRLLGSVRDFGSQRVNGAAIWATAIPTTDRYGVLDEARGEIARLPTALGGTTASDGRFEVLAETGTYYLSARLEPSTGYAWGIHMGLEVVNFSGALEIGALELPLPYPVTGQLDSSDAGGVPNALVRAYGRMIEGRLAEADEEADFVFPIAESRADDAGEFRLLLPSSL